MASQTLDSSADHNASVRFAELGARLADMIRGDFIVFQSALTSLEEYLQDFWHILNLDPAVKVSFGALLVKQRQECEVTGILHDNVLSRYDRFLNLVPCLRPYSNGCSIKNITAAELHQYPDGRRDEEFFRAKCQDD